MTFSFFVSLLKHLWKVYNIQNSKLRNGGVLVNNESAGLVVYGLQSKRPQVKTSPSQNVPELVKTSPKIGQNVPMVKNVGQNVPKMIFYSIISCNFRQNLGCLNKTVLDIKFF